MSDFAIYASADLADVVIENKYGEIIAELSQGDALDLARELSQTAGMLR